MEKGERKTFLKRFWNSYRWVPVNAYGLSLASTKWFNHQRSYLGIIACRAGVEGYPSGCATGCALGWASGCTSGCDAGCASGSFPSFLENCDPNKENASSSIVCIRRRVSFMSISESSLEALETDSDLSRFLSRFWNVTQHLSTRIN